MLVYGEGEEVDDDMMYGRGYLMRVGGICRSLTVIIKVMRIEFLVTEVMIEVEK